MNTADNCLVFELLVSNTSKRFCQINAIKFNADYKKDSSELIFFYKAKVSVSYVFVQLVKERCGKKEVYIVFIMNCCFCSFIPKFNQ